MFVPGLNKIALLIAIDTYYNKEPDWSPLLEPLHSCKKMSLISNFLFSKDIQYMESKPLIGPKSNKHNGWGRVRQAIIDFFIDSRDSVIIELVPLSKYNVI